MAWAVGQPAAGVLDRALADLRASRADAKWTAPGAYHLTAAFLGETEEARLAPLRACLRAAAEEASPPAEAALAELGAFPDWRRPRVLWAGVGPGAGALAASERALRPRLEEAGFPVEERPFVPHVTLGRLRSARGSGALEAAAAPWRRPEAWSGARFACGPLRLVSSVLTSAGPIHTELPA